MKFIKLFSFLIVLLNATFGVGQGNNMSKRESGTVFKNKEILSRNKYPTSYSLKFIEKIKELNSLKTYDSIKEVTTIENYDNQKIKITGNWHYFDYENFTAETMISHCPLLTNSDNIMLEISTRHEEKLNWRKKSDSEVLDQVKNNFESGVEISPQHTNIKTSKEKNYILYKVKKQSSRIENTFLEGFYLLGVKNDKVYRLALFNFDESQYENIEVFLENLYLTN